MPRLSLADRLSLPPITPLSSNIDVCPSLCRVVADDVPPMPLCSTYPKTPTITICLGRDQRETTSGCMRLNCYSYPSYYQDPWGRRRPTTFLMRDLSEHNTAISIVLSTPNPFSECPKSHAGPRYQRFSLPFCSPHVHPHTL